MMTNTNASCCCCCEMWAQKCLKEKENGGLPFFLCNKMNPPTTRFLYEYPSEVILGLQKEYRMDTDSASTAVFKILPLTSARNFGSFVRNRGVPASAGIDPLIAAQIEDVVNMTERK